MPMNIPLIKNGIVENVIIADYTDICPEGYEFGPQFNNEVRIGWLYDGEKYTDPNPSIITISLSNTSGQIA